MSKILQILSLHGDKVACRYSFSEDLWLANIDKGQISQVVQNIILHQLIVIVVSILLCSNFVQADQYLAQQRILKSASELDYPPFALVRPDGNADGFSVDLLKAIVKAINLEVNISVPLA